MHTQRGVELGNIETKGKLASATSMATKLAAIGMSFALCAFFYCRINEWAFHSTRTRYFRSPRDAFPGVIQPWTAVVYVFGGYIAPLVPFVYYWSWPRLRFVLRTYSLAVLMMFAVFLIFPVGMRRPLYTGGSFGERLMLTIFAVDRETNCFPSGHTVFAILPAILVSYGGAPRMVQAWVWILTTAICLTTVTTGQHYYMDVPAGAMTAILGFIASLRLERLRGPSTVPSSPR